MSCWDLLNGDPSFQELLLADLSDTAQVVFAQIWQLDTGPALLRLLRTHPRTSMTADDIAFRLGESPQLVEGDLKSLERLGIVRIIKVPNCTLFGLTSDDECRVLVQELSVWQDRWEARLDQLRHIVLGQREESLDADARAIAHFLPPVA